MKLADIKTKAEIWEVADIWYERAKSMNKIWQKEEEPIERRLKAHKIFIHYGILSLLIAAKANNIPREQIKYKRGSKKLF